MPRESPMCPACLSAAALLLAKAAPAGGALAFILKKLTGRADRLTPGVRPQGESL